ncbi:MAG: YfhO family protein, partial [Anaerolineae bacterium]|nr:YfhO family protein [Anaerolineae bacterium]
TEGDIAAIEQMRQTSFDPAQTVILHTDDPPDIQALGTGTATITHYEDTRVEITAKSDDGGYLVLSDAYFPGWQATIDAEAVPIIRANSLFKAIMLPPGEHDVVFEFVPSWLWALPFGAICWVISLLLALIFLWTSANPVEPASGSVNTR